jgi:pyruvate dehydrogenase (quinone)
MHRRSLTCDTLLIVGSNTPFSEFLPPEGKARGVQIDIDGRLVGLRFPTEVNLVGDSGATLRALLPLLDERPDDAWRRRVGSWTEAWWKTLEARARHDAEPLNPQLVFWELSTHLPDDAIITCDCGTATAWYARDVKLRRGMLASLSGNLALCEKPESSTASLRATRDSPRRLHRDGQAQHRSCARCVW